MSDVEIALKMFKAFGLAAQVGLLVVTDAESDAFYLDGQDADMIGPFKTLDEVLTHVQERMQDPDQTAFQA